MTESNKIYQGDVLEFAKTLPNLKCFFQFSTDEVFGPAPEGMSYKEVRKVGFNKKIEKIEALQAEKDNRRKKELGYIIQCQGKRK